MKQQMSIKDKHSDEIKQIILEDAPSALYKALASVQTNKDMKALMIDLCTPQELDALAERWLIARLLSRGDLSYRDINGLTGASTTTIGRVARFLDKEPYEGYKKALGEQA